MKVILFGLSVLFILVSDSQTRGLSYIGMCHKDVKGADVQSAFDGLNKVRIHFLIRTFNRFGCPSFEYLSRDERPMVLHLSLINGAGLRNRRLQKHEYFYGYTVKKAETAILKRDGKILRQVERAALEAATLLELREGRTTIVRVKPILESDFSRAARRIVFRKVEQVLPGIELIDNPVRGRCITGVLCETHGLNTTGDIVDLDGTSADEIDLQKWTAVTREKVGSFYWVRCNNGMRAGDDWIFPQTRKKWCNASELKAANAWLSS